MKSFKSGFVSIVGRPNVGKSTLMNNLLGEKIAIVSDKPQTTRNKIQCVLTTSDYQIIFIDTPGIHKPKHKLGEYMMKVADESLREVDLIIALVEPTTKTFEEETNLFNRLKNTKTPVFLVINKIDKIEKTKLLAITQFYKDKMDFDGIFSISALNGENTQELLASAVSRLPQGPMYFPEDSITDQPEKQIAAEIIREKALLLLEEEVPHGIAVEIISMKNRENDNSAIVDMEVTIYCEKDSHKGIIIGKNGAMLKKIGTNARLDIENLLGSKINLQLWVKIKNKWRDNESMLRNFYKNS